MRRITSIGEFSEPIVFRHFAVVIGLPNWTLRTDQSVNAPVTALIPAHLLLFHFTGYCSLLWVVRNLSSRVIDHGSYLFAVLIVTFYDVPFMSFKHAIKLRIQLFS